MTGRLRRRWLAGLLAAGAGGVALTRRAAGAAAPRQADVFPPQPGAHRVELDIDTRLPGTPVNRRVLGSNVQWVDGGDNLLGADDRFDPAMLALVRQLGPTVLRYPGGAQSDAYHWERGLGAQAGRGANEHVNARKPQPTRMGTREFLEVCEATGALPLVTLNLASGSPEEAARWLRATNIARMTSSITGRPLPRVAYWELGNEPYLTEERPDLAVLPAEFARRANRFIAALRALEPQAQIGLPLTSDRRNGIPVTHQFGFTRTVLAGLTERIDFASLHDAYLPFGGPGPGGRPADPAALYWGAMAGTRAIEADFAEMQALIAAARPGLPPLPFAITEYQGLFTLGQGATDDWVASPAAALYVADALRLFASTPQVLLANQWSLSANWRFGAIHAGRFPRPVFTAMALIGEALQGQRLPVAWRGETIATAGIGRVAPVAALPLVESLACRDGALLRVALIQKDPRRGAQGLLRLAGSRVTGARLQTWSCDDVLDARDARPLFQKREAALALAPAALLSFTLPPASLALLTLNLAAAA